MASVISRLPAGPHDSSPQWSPDGTRLAFVRAVEKDGKKQPPQIYILPADGGEAWQLTRLPKGAARPTWSPDGKTLAFNSTTNDEDLLQEACKAGKGTVTRASLRAAFAQQKIARSILGTPMAFTKNGDVAGAAFHIFKIVGGKYVTVA